MRVALIVESPIIMEAFTGCAAWKETGCELVGETSGIEQAKQFVSTMRPDIVAIDLTAYGNEGLTFVQYAARQLPAVRIIVLSDERTFRLALEAMKRYAAQCVPLPPDEAELCDALRRSVKAGGALCPEPHAMERAALRLADYATDPGARFEACKACLHEAGIEEDSRFALFLVQPQAPAYLLHAEAAAGRWKLWTEKLNGLCRRLKADMPELVVIPFSAGRETVVAVIYPDMPLFHSRETERIVNLHVDESSGELSLRVHASRSYYGLIHLRKAFAETVREAERSFFAKTSSDENVMPAANTGAGKPMRLDHLFDNPTEGGIRSHLPELFAEIVALSGGNSFTAKCLLLEACLSLYRSAARSGAVKETPYGTLVERIFRCADMHEAFDYIIGLLGSVKAYPDAADKEHTPVVKAVLAYVNAHYADNISLSQLAVQYNMNASYLSRLLSQETGTSFVDLLARIRIHHAKTLLREGTYRVKEAGEAVGYKDYSHFYMVFKKLEGVSPKEYMKHSPL